MVQRPVLHGKPQRVTQRSAGVIGKSSSSPTNDGSGLVAQQPQRQQQMILQALLRQYNGDVQYDDVLLLRRIGGRIRAYSVTDSEPQPKEVNLREYLGLTEGSVKQSPGIEPSSKKRRSSHSSSPGNKRRKSRLETDETDDDENYVSDAEDELDGVLDGQEGDAYYSQPMRISDLVLYFLIAFKMLGQLGCKDIGKAWIKMGHPKKQTTNPYNGGKTKEHSKRLYGHAGALTRPDYWPCIDRWEEGLGCRHQEPDHIKKPERLILLMHLLRCGHEKFTIEKLEKGTAQIEREIPKNFTTKSIKILRQIYYARRMEIRYENGEIDGDTVINLYMPKPPAKASKVPKATVGTLVKDEPSQRVAESKRTAQMPSDDLDLRLPITDEDLIGTQIDLNSAEDTKPVVLESTSASTASSIASEPVGLRPTQSWAPPSQSGITETGSASFVSVQRQWSPQSSFSRKRNLAHGPTSQSGGLPIERLRYPSRKLGMNAHTKSVRSTENQPQDGVRGPSQHPPATLSHSLPQQAHTPSYAGTYLPGHPRRPAHPTPMSFSGSSSGLAGLPAENSWLTNSNLPSARQFGMTGSIYTDGADPNALLTSYPSDITSSFGSDYSDNSFGSGLQVNSLNDTSQPQIQANQQVMDAQFRQQYPTYLTSNFNTLSIQPGPSDYSSSFPVDYSMGLETKFTPFDQEPRFS